MEQQKKCPTENDFRVGLSLEFREKNLIESGFAGAWFKAHAYTV